MAAHPTSAKGRGLLRSGFDATLLDRCAKRPWLWGKDAWQRPRWALITLEYMHSIRNLPSMRYRVPQEEDGVEDMTQLEDLQESAVLSNLKTRFERNLIYVSIPFLLLKLYIQNCFQGDEIFLIHPKLGQEQIT
ncbi:unconventional myosin-XV-like [Monodelphis domestica]|uniref:unconventional myosin-XV-like n=1 Tax=Monodelphis domestica TaxID=13616 RepID=UPI0024E26F83|nr:unconventional myosin-XV-like [Monodelphis domestica]